METLTFPALILSIQAFSFALNVVNSIVSYFRIITYVTLAIKNVTTVAVHIIRISVL